MGLVRAVFVVCALRDLEKGKRIYICCLYLGFFAPGGLNTWFGFLHDGAVLDEMPWLLNNIPIDPNENYLTLTARVRYCVVVILLCYCPGVNRTCVTIIRLTCYMYYQTT